MTMLFLGSNSTLAQLKIKFVSSSVHSTEFNSPVPRLAQSVERTVNVEDTGSILIWGGVLVLAKENIVILFIAPVAF